MYAPQQRDRPRRRAEAEAVLHRKSYAVPIASHMPCDMPNDAFPVRRKPGPLSPVCHSPVQAEKSTSQIQGILWLMMRYSRTHWKMWVFSRYKPEETVAARRRCTASGAFRKGPPSLRACQELESCCGGQHAHGTERTQLNSANEPTSSAGSSWPWTQSRLPGLRLMPRAIESISEQVAIRLSGWPLSTCHSQSYRANPKRKLKARQKLKPEATIYGNSRAATWH